MRHLTACKVSVSLSLLKWNYFFVVSLNYCCQHIFRGTIRKIISFFVQFKSRETNWNFIGYQMPQFMIVLILHIYSLNLSWIKKMCIFEEYGAFKTASRNFLVIRPFLYIAVILKQFPKTARNISSGFILFAIMLLIVYWNRFETMDLSKSEMEVTGWTRYSSKTLRYVTWNLRIIQQLHERGKRPWICL